MIETQKYFGRIAFVLFSVMLVTSLTFYAVADLDEDKNVFEDFDGDGLSNAEEATLGTDPHNEDTDGDGYKDGVEVDSGYNPLKPAPGDRLIEDVSQVKTTSQQLQEDGVGGLDENSTDALSLLIGDYVQQADEDEEAPLDVEAIDTEIENLLDKEIDLVELEQADIDRIIIKEQQYEDLSEEERDQKIKQDVIEYYTALGYVLREVSPEVYDAGTPQAVLDESFAKTQVASTSFDSLDYFVGMSEQMRGAKDYLYEIAVPEVMLDLHVELLQIMDYGDSVGDVQIDAETIAQDPMALYVNVARVGSMVTLLQDLRGKWEERLGELGISFDDFAELPIL